MYDVQSTFPIGSLIRGRYTVVDLLGQGASGAVYLVRDKRNQQTPFVLKQVLHAVRKERFGFFFYARMLRRLKHAALPRINQVFRSDAHDRFYILMDYVEGRSLEAVQQTMAGKCFSLPEAMTFMSPIIDAVSYLHRQQPPLIHGDIKPTNIIVPKSGTPSMLVDFGGIKELRSGSTAHQSTHHYRAPEQYSEGTSPSTDIYALGAIFYTLLTGTVPAAVPDRLLRLSEKEPDPLRPMNQITPYVRTTVAQAIHRALSINSYDRFATVEQFWEALWQLIYANPVMTQVPTIATTVPIKEPLELEVNPTGQEISGPAITTPIEENREPDTNPVVSQITEPGITMPEFEFTISIANPTTGMEPESTDASSDPPFTPALPEEGKPSIKASLFERLPIHRFKKYGLPLLLFLALLVSIGSGLFYMAGYHLPSTVLPLSARQFKATPGHISRVTATVVPVPSPYPNVARPYNGTIYDIPDSVTTKMSLTGIQQQQRNIRGYFSGLLRNSPFNGTISTAGHIHFIVTGKGQQATISFDGNMQSDGNLGGSYCSPNQVTQCSNYGVWSVSPHP